MIRCALFTAAFLLAGCVAKEAPAPAVALANADQLPADGWITMPGLADTDVPVVLGFRRDLEFVKPPKRFEVDVTADNRFILFVNGTRVASGPSTGDLGHWRVARIDLAPHLRAGRNTIAVKVWNGVKPPAALRPEATDRERQAAQGRELFTQAAPIFQQSAGTGFRLVGLDNASDVSTGLPGWRVMRDEGHSLSNGWAQIKRYYYVAGAPERIDAARSPSDWQKEVTSVPRWSDAVAASSRGSRTLVRDKLPAQSYRRVDPGAVVRTDLAGAQAFPATPVVVPANTKAKILIDRGTMVSAYPVVSLSGGAGAKIGITYSEALYDEQRQKGDRNLVGERQAFGITDTIVADGASRTLGPLWWRTWRFMELAIETGEAPLTLVGLEVNETGYPFEQTGTFASDDPELTRIFDIGWRTARVGAHETYMDTPFWEQLQYVGDTRLQMLISYAVSGDPRLAENAIDLIAASRAEGGLVEAAYPTRGSNVIATFTPVWVAMLDDWRIQQPDPAPILRNLTRMREALGWIDRWIAPSGLLRKNPEWNFVDWAGQPATDRERFPSFGRQSGTSCLTTVVWLGAVQQGARIEAQLGDPAFAASYDALAQRMRDGIRRECWSADRGIFADNPDRDVFSQHMNALAVLYDVAAPEQAGPILDRITVAGGGVDAPEGMFEVSYYFSWYLVRAFEHAGQPDRYFDLLKTWRGLLALNYTTWPEERGNTRSDTHAWSAHPTADLLGIVAGVGPGAPGYATIRIAPTLGPLMQVAATVATPHGPVAVDYRRDGAQLKAVIDVPANVPAEFHWKGRRLRLSSGRNVLEL